MVTYKIRSLLGVVKRKFSADYICILLQNFIVNVYEMFQFKEEQIIKMYCIVTFMLLIVGQCL